MRTPVVILGVDEELRSIEGEPGSFAGPSTMNRLTPSSVVGQAVANPLHIPVSGPLASVITRGYHLYALPGNRLRVATDWLTDIIDHSQFVQLGLIPSEYSGLAAAEHTDIYHQTDGPPLDRQQQESTT
jgi:hypothetical protein